VLVALRSRGGGPLAAAGKHCFFSGDDLFPSYPVRGLFAPPEDASEGGSKKQKEHKKQKAQDVPQAGSGSRTAKKQQQHPSAH